MLQGWQIPYVSKVPERKFCIITVEYNDPAFDEEYKLDHLKERKEFR